MIVHTGTTVYEFADGARAIYGTGPEWYLAITLAAGGEVLINVSPKRCDSCGYIILIGENRCRKCDQVE